MVAESSAAAAARRDAAGKGRNRREPPAPGAPDPAGSLRQELRRSNPGLFPRSQREGGGPGGLPPANPAGPPGGAKPRYLPGSPGGAGSPHPGSPGSPAARRYGRGPAAAPEPEPEGELLLFGRLVGCTGHRERGLLGRVLGVGPELFCEWELAAGEAWTVAEGAPRGTTLACAPAAPGPGDGADGPLAVWSHPVELRLRSRTLQGWPKLVLKVHRRFPLLGRDAFAACGCVSVPAVPGAHRLECQTWRPNGQTSWGAEELAGFFTGMYPQLLQEHARTFVHARASDVSHTVQTVGMGKVVLELTVLPRHLERFMRAPPLAGPGAAAAKGEGPGAGGPEEESEGVKIVRGGWRRRLAAVEAKQKVAGSGFGAQAEAPGESLRQEPLRRSLAPLNQLAAGGGTGRDERRRRVDDILRQRGERNRLRSSRKAPEPLPGENKPPPK